MANAYGLLDQFNIIGTEVIDDYPSLLSPLKIWSLDASQEVALRGQSITWHLNNTVAAPAVQVVSGSSAISYADAAIYSDINASPATVNLWYFQPNGFKVPELVAGRSTVKDLYGTFGPEKIQGLANAVVAKVYTAINSTNYSHSVAISGGYDWTKHCEVVAAAKDLNFPVARTTVVLNNTAYMQFTASLGAQAANFSKDVFTGAITDITGIKIMASSVLPSGCRGFITTNDAMAIAMRPQAALESELSYGLSKIVTDPKGSGISLRVGMSQDRNGQKYFNVDTLYGFTPFNGNALIRLV